MPTQYRRVAIVMAALFFALAGQAQQTRASAGPTGPAGTLVGPLASASTCHQYPSQLNCDGLPPSACSGDQQQIGSGTIWGGYTLNILEGHVYAYWSPSCHSTWTYVAVASGTMCSWNEAIVYAPNGRSEDSGHQYGCSVTSNILYANAGYTFRYSGIIDNNDGANSLDITHQF